ncbi:MAG: hypothetical protein HYV38_02585 [Candidatus Levybacteria bacterium]|nr:hypothetical protein [Candidatus Levybacteria bacterium]MBI2420944.1 hypothetical protein [Candidatus Levybacteria bacterium]
MDPQPPDLPRPEVSEPQEVVTTTETSPLLKLIEAQKEVDRAREATFRTYLETTDKAKKLAELVEGRLPIAPRTRDTDFPARKGVLTTSEGREIEMRINLFDQEASELDRLRFADPADPERSVMITLTGVRLGFKDNALVVKGGDYDWAKEWVDEPPDRDPLDAAREGLDYFLQHADELRLVEPAQPGGQTPPAPNTPPTPPTQPAPSV